MAKPDSRPAASAELTPLAVQAEGPACYRLSGNLDFSTVPALLNKGFDWLRQPEQVRLDLAAVEHCNSAGMGLLIEYLRQARRYQTTLHFENVPASLLAIAEICGIQDWFAESTP